MVELVKLMMASSRSSLLNLLSNSDTSAHKERKTSSIAWKIFNGTVILVVCLLLFCVAHILINGFGNDDIEHKLYQDLNYQHGRAGMLRKMLPDEGRDVDDAVFNQFESLIKDLNISYTSQNEILKRFGIFISNLKRIKHIQSLNNNTLFEVNRFALMSDDELRGTLMPDAENAQTLIMLKSESQILNMSITNLPTRPAFIDWRTRNAVTRVKDQGACGACWAFAVTATIESMRAIRGYPLEERSEQQLIDCSYENYGCHGGSLQNGFRYIAQKGQTLEKLYSYTGKLEPCLNISKPKVKISGWKHFPLNEDYLADWVAAIGPVATGIAVTRDFFLYKSGVLNPTLFDHPNLHLGFHALTIVGYGTENGEDYWLLKNSMGTAIGDHGYLKLKRGINCWRIGEYAVAPVP